jgi:AAA15 family ATPase/GTPase
MESIEINGFLTIDNASFEIKKINILIGAQAQGKSVIAKLVYFFRTFFSDIFINSIQKLETKREIEKNSLFQFEQIFPRYSWVNNEFSIIYKSGNYHVSLSRFKIGNKFTLKFSYCNELIDIHKQLKSLYKSALDKTSLSIDEDERSVIFYDLISEKLPEIEFSGRQTFYIPASRSFFATLQKNIFSFLAMDIDIDPFIKRFGSKYEFSKRIHQLGIHSIVDDVTVATKKKIDKLASDIISGDYVYLDEQDWIINNGKRTNLANASSGQQESLPMLLVLSIWPFFHEETPPIYFIEEPETHLFPSSQKQIISLIATIYNAFGHSFFITTHSPYILTAINNLAVGKDAYDKAIANGDTERLEQLEKVLSADELIRLEDVSAYTLNKGKLESIIDMENRLIGMNLLDAVSDEFDRAFGVATQILYGDD